MDTISAKEIQEAQMCQLCKFTANNSDAIQGHYVCKGFFHLDHLGKYAVKKISYIFHPLNVGKKPMKPRGDCSDDNIEVVIYFDGEIPFSL